MSIDSGSSAGGGWECHSYGEQGCQSASKSSVYPLEIAKLMREAFAAAWPQVRPINKNRELTLQLLASAIIDQVDTGARGKDEIVAAAVARVGVVHGDLAPQTVTWAHSRRIGVSRTCQPHGRVFAAAIPVWRLALCPAPISEFAGPDINQHGCDPPASDINSPASSAFARPHL